MSRNNYFISLICPGCCTEPILHGGPAFLKHGLENGADIRASEVSWVVAFQSAVEMTDDSNARVEAKKKPWDQFADDKNLQSI